MAGPETITLEDGDVAVTLLTLGCITQSWQVPFGGDRRHVVLGYRDASDYLSDKNFMGIIAGRVANRISGAKFTHDGNIYSLPANDVRNTLHSGPNGLGRRFWTAERDGAKAVRFSYTSPNGEEGFPGQVDFAVTVRLDGFALTYEMVGTPDRPTPIALAQHSYYNLAGGGDIMEHSIRMRASRFTETDDALLPTGRILPVTETPLDFTTAKTLGDADPDKLGADDNLIVDTGDAPIVEMNAPNSPHFKLWSDQIGLQLYTGMHLSGGSALHDGQTLMPFAGVALEPQTFPNAINIPDFPSIIATPDQIYRQVTRVEITP